MVGKREFEEEGLRKESWGRRLVLTKVFRLLTSDSRRRRKEEQREEVFMDVGESGEAASVAPCLIGGPLNPGGQKPRLRLLI